MEAAKLTNSHDQATEQRECAALAGVERRLATRFARQHSPDHVRHVIQECHARFRSARVREFVPILVERQAAQHLAARR